MEILAARDYLVRYASAQDVLEFAPDFEALKREDKFAVIVTAPGIVILCRASSPRRKEFRRIQ